MQIVINSQEEYDNLIRAKKHIGNEVVIQENKNTDFIFVRTDVTVGRNGRARAKENANITMNVTNNGIAAAEGKTKIIGRDNANIIAKGHCKVELYDDSMGNCYDHCNITLKGFAKANADGKCQVHAYDQSFVSATGSTKVYSYQSTTAKGSDISTINAKDNCIVYAKDNCNVKASDNCLIVAQEFANITAADNCLVMSNYDNPNIKLMDKCEHLNLSKIDEKNIMGALRQMAQSKAVVERRLTAIQILKENIPQNKKLAVENKLNAVGLKDQTAINNYISKHIEVGVPSQKNQTQNQNLTFGQQLELAKKTGYVQGVCECVAAVGGEYQMGKKLLSEMNVNRDMAKKFANPETYKVLEQGIFAQKQEQKLEQGVKR